MPRLWDRKKLNQRNKLLIVIGLTLPLIGALSVAGILRENQIPFLLGGYQTLPLDGHQRLLVLAPHCDDETLGAAGLMQEAQRRGMEIRVVIATNGDGYLFATMRDFHRLYPRPADFIRLGNLRQEESLNALGLLGVQPDQVSFLSYPDRGLSSMWNDHWSADNPYRSPYSRATHSPYNVTYNPDSVYAGEDLLADLRSILDSYQPDLVIYPHPDDIHSDHWGLSAFTRLALALEEHDRSDFHPDAFAYLVHRSDFPIPKKLHPQDYLDPPAVLLNLGTSWQTLPLSEDEVNRKAQAVLRYRSQLPLLRNLLESFIRQNELFSQPETITLARLSQGELDNPDTWRDANGDNITPVQRDPARDFITRDVIVAADLVELYAAQDAQDQLVVCARVRKKADAALIYELRVKASGAQGVVDHVARNHRGRTDWHRAQLAGEFICDQVGLSELGSPWLVAIGANVRELGVGTLDQIAWQMVDVP